MEIKKEEKKRKAGREEKKKYPSALSTTNAMGDVLGPLGCRVDPAAGCGLRGQAAFWADAPENDVGRGAVRHFMQGLGPQLWCQKLG